MLDVGCAGDGTLARAVCDTCPSVAVTSVHPSATTRALVAVTLGGRLTVRDPPATVLVCEPDKIPGRYDVCLWTCDMVARLVSTAGPAGAVLALQARTGTCCIVSVMTADTLEFRSVNSVLTWLQTGFLKVGYAGTVRSDQHAFVCLVV